MVMESVRSREDARRCALALTQRQPRASSLGGRHSGVLRVHNLNRPRSVHGQTRHPRRHNAEAPLMGGGGRSGRLSTAPRHELRRGRRLAMRGSQAAGAAQAVPHVRDDPATGGRPAPNRLVAAGRAAFLRVPPQSSRRSRAAGATAGSFRHAPSGQRAGLRGRSDSRTDGRRRAGRGPAPAGTGLHGTSHRLMSAPREQPRSRPPVSRRRSNGSICLRSAH
jgi:hypothetical protein